MKISVSSYSFKQCMDRGELDQFTAIGKAKELGFDFIEFTDLMPPEGESSIDFAKRLREEADRLGMGITCYAVGACMALESDEEDDIEFEKICRELDVAKVLKVPVFRHDAAFKLPKRFPFFDTSLPKMTSNIRRITEYAEKLGIKTTIENHGFICQDSDRVEKIITSVNHPNFGLLLDMGNFMCTDQQSATAVSRCAPYAFHVHAKDFHFLPYSSEEHEGYFRTRGQNFLKGAILGEGVVPVEQCLKIIKNAGYDGFCTIEFEGSEPCYEALKKGLENLKTFLKNI